MVRMAWLPYDAAIDAASRFVGKISSIGREHSHNNAMLRTGRYFLERQDTANISGSWTTLWVTKGDPSF